MKLASGALLLVLTVAGCGSATNPVEPPGPATTAATQVIQAFELYTHCGIRETRVGTDYYAAAPVLDDGNGNPPTGWGNPGQVGTMSVYANGTAHFSAPGGLEADFRQRPGATTWATICS